VNFPNITQKNTINWDDTGSETGYVIFKDGVAIANLGPNVVKYVESFNVFLGMSGTVKYGVQTVIGSSTSSPADKSINICN
jgi:hypothetical protein